MAHRAGKATNVAASVRAKLSKLVPEYGLPFADLLLLYTLEGMLRRLAHSPYREQMILKGGLLLFGLHTNLSRPTRDLDLMGQHLPLSPDAVASLVRAICAQPLPEDDGLSFDPDSVQTEIILEENDYQGVRAKLYGYLDRARSRIVIDIAAGDPIIPDARELSFSTLLGQEPLLLKAYSTESLIAEKFHALVQRGLRTSRLKDCHDLWALSREHTFDGALLQQAIQATFAARGLAFTPELPSVLTPEFAENTEKQVQWEEFRKEKNAAAAPLSLAEALIPVITFLKPIWQASADGQTFSGSWDYADSIWREATENQPAETALPSPEEPATTEITQISKSL